MSETDPAYIAARRVLLEALDALHNHLSSIVLVGAQAIYLRTQDSRLRSAPYTTDGDLAINPSLLVSEPELATTMAAAGFSRDPSGGRAPQPGLWYKAALVGGIESEVEIDLLVPEAALAHGKERGARLANHSPSASRLVPGIEAALVDFSPMTIAALDDDNTRSVSCNVAGEAALVVAKLHKLKDRLAVPGDGNRRLDAKDAGDLVRLFLASDGILLRTTLRWLQDDPIAGSVTTAALDVLTKLFGGRRTPGTILAIRALEADLPAAQVEVICTEFARSVSEP